MAVGVKGLSAREAALEMKKPLMRLTLAIRRPGFISGFIQGLHDAQNIHYSRVVDGVS